MQYLIIGLDGSDSDGQARRQAARSQHIALGEELIAKGNFWYGAALTDDSGMMVGSVLIMDFPSRADLDSWLAVEPYVTEGVWKSVDIRPCNVRDPWIFNRTPEFFDEYKPTQR